MVFGAGLYLLWVPIDVGIRGEDLTHVGTWLSVAISLGWGGSILWYFRRPAVKAQFVQPRAGT